MNQINFNDIEIFSYDNNGFASFWYEKITWKMSKNVVAPWRFHRWATMNSPLGNGEKGKSGTKTFTTHMKH